ncbi:SDR family oxidoreductase [Flavilitoribacter nigricans]|uniref:NAD(P)-dependent oxidoreductase n=1 Tax=Flavilitoribacter nigricans (strain ATCC 23147 / DSM 23189 / NBRC 102662 / NCIMB 1420 / SS-2) TaxID=1122177 RepID=A0A2D0NBD7_FLAN2|nr:SDR family oxidoreductase [Flavilitoribacter nigricans]PHN05807.1 NAD(P)-dependent oxidoreductase [Flavilitoribacter nigricans DSM 23189 = NBRC 102662]
MSDPIKKISILGCGWLGLPLGAELVRSGFSVYGSTTSPEKLETLEAAGIQAHLIEVGETLTGDIDDFFRTDLLILNIPPGRRRPDVADRYPAEIKLVVDQALAQGTSRIIFISSTSVYPDLNRVITEEDAPAADSGSGLALVRCEQYLATLPDLSLTILRMAGLAGGNRKPGRFLAGKTDVSNGRAPVNMVHRDDCIAIIQEVIRESALGDTFNICADQHPSRKEFYRHQAQKDGFEPPTFAPEGETHYKIISNQKIKDRLQYTFRYPDPMDF